MLRIIVILVFISALISGCATATIEAVHKPETQPQISKTIVAENVKGLKRKVVIARFTNETKHGNSFLLDESNDRIGKQASDILAARLTESGKFLMFERQDLNKIKAEQDLANITPKLVGADYLIIGSVSEFGRTTTSEVGIFSRNMKQRANATVNVRLVDVTTGQIIFSQEGSGESLSGGGNSSGLMSFLKIGDRAAGAIKSGGTTRRAAKMVCLDIDHPDIEEFIAWKVIEEQKVAALVTGSKIIKLQFT